MDISQYRAFLGRIPWVSQKQNSLTEVAEIQDLLEVRELLTWPTLLTNLAIYHRYDIILSSCVRGRWVTRHVVKIETCADLGDNTSAF